MKLHKIEVYVIDFDDYGGNEYESIIAQDCPGLTRAECIGTVDIGEFEDEHILNQLSAPLETFQNYFVTMEKK